MYCVPIKLHLWSASCYYIRKQPADYGPFSLILGQNSSARHHYRKNCCHVQPMQMRKEAISCVSGSVAGKKKVSASSIFSFPASSNPIREKGRESSDINGSLKNAAIWGDATRKYMTLLLTDLNCPSGRRLG